MSENFSDQFRLSITKALSSQLFEALDKLKPEKLTQENLEYLAKQGTVLGLSNLAGVYQLFRVGTDDDLQLAYVGKADKSLPERLGKHRNKLSGRCNISLDEMYFRCLFVEEDLSSVSPEKMLIKRLKGSNIAWNNRGFGNNDPGRRRDKTTIKENHFDREFPIDLDCIVKGLAPGDRSLQNFLSEVKNGLPYLFRFEESKTFAEFKVSVPSVPLTANDAFIAISLSLPSTWQICALMGWVIMYEDGGTPYKSAIRYYRQGVVDKQIPKVARVRAGESADSDDGEGEQDES